MPGSHRPDFSAAIDAWEARNRAMDAEQLWRRITGLPCYCGDHKRSPGWSLSPG